MRQRRLSIEEAGRVLGVSPSTVWRRVPLIHRGGSIVADRSLSFAEVMTKRFDDPVGRVAGSPRQVYSGPWISFSGSRAIRR